MIAEYPKDAHERNQLFIEIDRIHRECPRFAAFLAASVKETMDVVCASVAEYHWKQTGALDDLLRISGLVADPPKEERAAPAPTTGMEV